MDVGAIKIQGKAHVGLGSNRDEDDWLESVSPNHPLLSESYQC